MELTGLSFDDVKKKIEEKVFASPGNCLVRVVGYTDDKSAMYCQLLSKDNGYVSGDLELPELMKVTLAELNENTSGLRGQRSTIADRANPGFLGYLKGDPNTGGICFLQSVEVLESTSTATIDGDDKTFTDVQVRWISGVVKTTEPVEGVDTILKAKLGCAISVQYFEADASRQKAVGVVKLIEPRQAKVVGSLDEVKKEIIEHFNLNVPKLEPFSVVRISDGKQSIAIEITRRSKRNGNEWITVYGEEAFRVAVSGKERTSWEQVMLYVEWANAQGNEHCTVEVMPGLIEFMSKKQLEDSRLFDENGRFINDDKRAYYNSHWRLPSGEFVYYESHAVLRYIPHKEVWVFGGHEPIRGGKSSLIGAPSMFKTASFSPSEDMKQMLKNFRTTTTDAEPVAQGSQQQNDSAVSNAINDNAAPSDDTGLDDGFDLDNDFEPDIL